MTRHPTFWATAALTPQASLHELFATRLDEAVSSMRVSTRGVGGSALAKQTAASAWFLECLYQGFCCLPSAAVALPRRVAAYSSNRLDAVPHGYDVVTRVLEAAKSLGWITVTLGRDGGDTGEGEVTRVQARGELLTHFHALGVRWQEFGSPPREQLVILAEGEKGTMRRLVERDEEEHVAQMQDNLHRINEFLLTQCIHLNCSDELLVDPEDGVVAQGKIKATPGRYNPKDRPRALNFQNVAMRRIFAHGSLYKGGRFYHGWWQHIRSEYREHILIKDHLTVECDYSGIALVCLYAREHQTMDEGDPYDIGLDYVSSSDPRRKVVKQYVNAIINDAKRTYRIDKESLRKLGLPARELRRRVYRRHRKIKHKFHTGVGLELQYVDSKIAEQVMLRFVEMDEVCLPVHDSFIVRRGLQHRLLSIMQTEFERETNTTIEIRSTVAEGWPGIGTLADSVRPPPGVSVEASVIAMAAQHMASYSIFWGYLNSWRERCMTEDERRNEDLAIDEQMEALKDAGRPWDPVLARPFIESFLSTLTAMSEHPGEMSDSDRDALRLAIEELRRTIP